MCGLVGILRKDSTLGEGSRETAARVDRMSEAIRHRGPNSTGAISTTFCEARFRRLSIVDLLHGDQPLWNERRDVAVLFNGEIYNHAEIRRDLERAGHRLGSGSDGAVIPHLFEEMGDRFADALNGMYAILVVDLVNGRILLSRDPVGIKPLYLADTASATIFGSELRAILASGLVEREIDEDAWCSVPSFLAIAGPRTAVRGIEEVDPGATVVLDRDGGRRVVHRPLIAGEDTMIADESVALSILRREVDAAVARQVVADVPVGLALSGGVDSIVVAAALNAEARARLVAITVDFQHEAHREEIATARLAARELGIAHAVERIDPMDAIESLPALVWSLDIPNADPAALSMSIVAKAAARSVTVLLSGTGGDEVFGGYGHFGLTRRHRLLRRVPPWMRGLVPVEKAGTPAWRKLRQHAVESWMSDRSLATIAARFVRPPEFACDGAIERYRACAAAAWREGASLDLTNRHLFTDLRTYLGGQTLPILDRLTMAEGLEGRVPLLDLELLRAAFSIDGTLKFRDGEPSKRLLRRLAAERLPASIARMPKLGFMNPIEQAMRDGSLAAAVRLVAADRDALLRRLGHGGMLDRIADGRIDLRTHWLAGYSVLVCALWERMHLRDGLTTAPSCGLSEYLGLGTLRRAG